MVMRYSPTVRALVALLAGSAQRHGRIVCGSVQLPLGWQVYIDASSGKPYYHEAASGKVQWEAPAPKPDAESFQLDMD